jgi:hypothetical protein
MLHASTHSAILRQLPLCISRIEPYVDAVQYIVHSSYESCSRSTVCAKLPLGFAVYCVCVWPYVCQCDVILAVNICDMKGYVMHPFDVRSLAVVVEWMSLASNRNTKHESPRERIAWKRTSWTRLSRWVDDVMDCTDLCSLKTAESIETCIIS